MLYSLTALVTQLLTPLTFLGGWSSLLCSLQDKRRLESPWLRLREPQGLFVQDRPQQTSLCGVSTSARPHTALPQHTDVRFTSCSTSNAAPHLFPPTLDPRW